MSWNRIIVILLSFYIFNNTLLSAKEVQSLPEDSLIIQGLLFEEYKSYENSRKAFATLYDNTGAKEYLFREVTASLLGNTHITQSIKRLERWDKKHPNTIEVKRLLIPLYIINKQIDEAKDEAKDLLAESTEAKDIDMASNPYLYSGEYKRALELLKKAYKKSSDEGVLLRIVAILDQYDKNPTEAIQMLEMHRRMHPKVSKELYFKLLSLYIKENNIDGVLDCYKELYELEKQQQYLKKVIEAYIYKKDLDGAIKYLEDTGYDDKILYDLYKAKKDYAKALVLVKKFYAESKDPKWLADEAVITYEKAKNKDDKVMIKRVLSLFEEALKRGVDDSLYLNYYGYTLIDKDIDLKRGMQIVKDALKQQPENTYYLDSLAWGYYKLGECKKAYEIMKKVVDIEGLEEPELATHWSKIKSCK